MDWSIIWRKYRDREPGKRGADRVTVLSGGVGTDHPRQRVRELAMDRGMTPQNPPVDYLEQVRVQAFHRGPELKRPGCGGATPEAGALHSVLIRIDGAGSTHELLDWLTARDLAYSVGFGLPDNTVDLLAKLLEQAWSPALDLDLDLDLDADGEIHDGALGQ